MRLGGDCENYFVGGFIYKFMKTLRRAGEQKDEKGLWFQTISDPAKLLRKKAPSNFLLFWSGGVFGNLRNTFWCLPP